MIDFSKIQEITLGGKVVVSITDADGLALWNADKTDGFIRGTFNITDATASYPVVWRNYSAYEYALVDGEKIDSPQTARTWTVGEHKVELKIKDGATNFSYMFYTLPYTSMDFSTAGLNKAKAYNFSYMVYSCKQLTELDLTPIDFSQATAVPSFYYLQALTSLKLNSTYGVGMQMTTANLGGWFNNCALTEIDTSNWDVSNMTSLANTFYCCRSLKSLDLSTWIPVNNVSLNVAFNYCEALTDIKFGDGWGSMRKLTNAERAFANCTSLTTLNLSKLDLSSATNVKNFVADCTKVTEITLPKSFASGQLYSYFFSGDNKLKKINNLSGMVTSSATALDSVFYYNYALESVDGIEEWNTQNVTTFNSLFANCTSLKTVDLSKWNTSKCTSFRRVFYNCSSLESVNISGWNTSNISNTDDMFTNTNNLTNIIFGENFGNWTLRNVLVLSNCGSSKYFQLTDATYESMLNMYDRASNNKTASTIKFSSKHNIPDGFIDKMTARGYTITKS